MACAEIKLTQTNQADNQEKMIKPTVENTDNGVSTTEPDWLREQLISCTFEPSKHLLRCLRQHEVRKNIHNLLIKRVLLRLVVLRLRVWSAICGADIPFNNNLQGGLLIPHPNGIVIHPEAHVGPNCKL